MKGEGRPRRRAADYKYSKYEPVWITCDDIAAEGILASPAQPHCSCRRVQAGTRQHRCAALEVCDQSHRPITAWSGPMPSGPELQISARMMAEHTPGSLLRVLEDLATQRTGSRQVGRLRPYSCQLLTSAASHAHHRDDRAGRLCMRRLCGIHNSLH